MKAFIEFLVTSLVKNPQSVAVEETQEGSNYRYTIAVDPADMGLIIGKEGRTINSIRSLAKAKAVKEGVWVDIQLLDNRTENPVDKHAEHQVDKQTGVQTGDVTASNEEETTDQDHA